MALRDDHTEVMLAVWIVVGVEVVITPQRLDDLPLDFLPKGRDPLREHDAATGEGCAKGVVERANAINAGVDETMARSVLFMACSLDWPGALEVGLCK